MGVYLRNKIWWMCFKVPSGQYIRESTNSTNKKTAKAILAKQQVAIIENRYFDVKRESNIAFTELSNLFLERHSKPKKKSWKRSDALYIKRLDEFFGNKPLSSITQELVEEYVALRRSKIIGEIEDGSPKYLSSASVNREITCLKTMFNKAIEWGKVTASPCAKVKKLKEPQKAIAPLSIHEIDKLMEHASLELQQIITVLLHTGMRKGELQNLKWKDVDFERDQITLTQTKNGKIRYVPMNRIVKFVLLQRRIAKQSTVWVFAGSSGEPYNFQKAFETARSKAGLKHVRIHDLRHQFASHLCMEGADLMTVKELLGHSSLAMTERYSHLTNRHKADAVARLEGLPFNHVTNVSQSEKRQEPKKFDNIVSVMNT